MVQQSHVHEGFPAQAQHHGQVHQQLSPVVNDLATLGSQPV
ncbi:hypothetical protein ABT124_50080 [Streptomyces sp. NPDC001982]